MTSRRGDSGDWCCDSMDPPRMTTKARIDTGISTTSAAVREAMAAEDAFLATISGRPDPHRFGPRTPPSRNKLLPG